MDHLHPLARPSELPQASCIFLVRHGETDWNAQGRIQGSLERELNANGRKQAWEVAQQLQSFGFSAIYSSPMIRARQTAEIIAARCSCPILFDSDLREGCFGMAEGMTKEEYFRTYAKQLEERKQLSFDARLHHKVLPDAESSAELAERAIQSLQRICQTHCNKNILVVTHGFVMRALYIYLQRFEESKIVVKNTAVIRIDGNGEHFKVVDHHGLEILM